MEKTNALEALGALAQDTRLDIFQLLVRQGPSGLSAGAIGDRVGVPATTLSFHLSQLAHADLVLARREGRSIIYAAAYDTVQDLLRYLIEDCCQGDAREMSLMPGACAPQTCAKE